MTYLLHCAVAFGVNPNVEPEPADWTDITSRVRDQQGAGVSVSGGREHELDQFAAVSGTVMLNNRDRHLDPTYTASPFHDDLVPLTHIRVQVEHDTTVHPLFRGFVESWPQHYPHKGHDAVSPVEVVDAFKWLALIDDDLDLPEQPSGDRINAILDVAGWPATKRQVDTGRVTLEPFEKDNVSLLEILQDTADAEDGVFFMDREGNATFHGRHRRLDLDNVGAAAFVEDTFTSYDDIQAGFDDTMLINDARVELANGDVFQWIDPTSRDRYGLRTWRLYDPPLRGVEAEALAGWRVVRYREPHIRPQQVTFNSGHVGDVLARSYGDPVRVVQTHDVGDPTTFDAHIEHVSHTFGVKVWETRWQLSPWFGAGPWLTFDVEGAGFNEGAFAP